MRFLVRLLLLAALAALGACVASEPDTPAQSAAALSGARWQPIGPRNFRFDSKLTSGRVNAAAFDPSNSNTLYVGAALGGLWKSVDAGQHFFPLSDDWPGQGVTSLAVDPSASATVWVGTSFGVMKSTNGFSFTRVAPSTFGDSFVAKLLLHPDDPQTVLVAANNGIWRSTDGGGMWAAAVDELGAPLPGTWSADLACGVPDVLGARVCYLATVVSDRSFLWRSTDRGATWSPLAASPLTSDTQGGLALAASPLASDRIYVLSASDNAVYQSDDAGAHWRSITGNIRAVSWYQAGFDFTLACSSAPIPGTGRRRDVLYVGLFDFWQSLAPGAWLPRDGGHVDFHSVTVNPNDPDDLLLGNDGGVFRARTGLGGLTWALDASLNGTLQTTLINGADYHPTNPRFILAGAQDNGGPATYGDLSRWAAGVGGDGGFVAINPQNPSIQYLSQTGGQYGVWHTTDRGAHWSSITPCGCPTDVGPLVLDPNNPYLLYWGGRFLHQWNESRGRWSRYLGRQLADPVDTSDVITAIAVARGDSGRIYVGTRRGLLWVSTRSGADWTRVDTGTTLPDVGIESISILPTNANELLLGLDANGHGSVWRCTGMDREGGSCASVSGADSTALPDVTVRSLARDPYDPTFTVYAGTDVGAFYTTDRGLTWHDITRPLGLPRVQVTDVKAVPGVGFLYAATYGRGIYRMPLSSTVTRLGGFRVDATSACGGTTLQGTIDLTAPAPFGGLTVVLDTSDATQATVPTTVLVPEGATHATFPITIGAVPATSTVRVTASFAGLSLAFDLSLLPGPLAAFGVSPAEVDSGATSTATLTLCGAAGESGVATSLTSDDPSLAWFVDASGAPLTSLTVPAGVTSVQVTVQTALNYGAPRTVSLHASSGMSSVDANLFVRTIVR